MTSEQPKKQEDYGHDYKGAMTQHAFTQRTVEKQGGFFLPHLRDGMNLLDCGCGPGTITVGLAQAIPSGHVTGIDIAESQIELARERSAELELSNTTFETASVYELPYPDNQFDAVFGHAIMEHMQNPVTVLKEMHRVLKPGGIVGVRSPDLGTAMYAPADDKIDKMIEILTKLRGKNSFIGRRLRALVHEAGFINTVGTASVESHGTTEATRSRASIMADEFSSLKTVEAITQAGLADAAFMERATQNLRDWGNRPDAFISITWGEAVGWKSS